VNALVCEFQGCYLHTRSRRLQALHRFEAVAAGSHSASDAPRTREELHERG